MHGKERRGPCWAKHGHAWECSQLPGYSGDPRIECVTRCGQAEARGEQTYPVCFLNPTLPHTAPTSPLTSRSLPLPTGPPAGAGLAAAGAAVGSAALTGLAHPAPWPPSLYHPAAPPSPAPDAGSCAWTPGQVSRYWSQDRSGKVRLGRPGWLQTHDPPASAFWI